MRKRNLLKRRTLKFPLKVTLNIQPNVLHQKFPGFLAPETGFMEDRFSTELGRWGLDGFKMIQAHSAYCEHFISLVIESALPRIIRR